MQNGGSKLRRLLGRLTDSLVDPRSARYWYGAAVLVVFVAALLAFYLAPRETEPANRLLDSVVRSLQIFFLNFEPGTIEPVPLAIYLIVLTAGLLTILGALALLFRAAWERLARWRQARFATRRAVLLGFGLINRAVARSLRAEGYEVTAADLSFDDGARRLASEHGILLVPADLSDPDSFGPLRLERPARIIVALGNDIANVELGSSLMRENGPLVFIHVTDVQLAASLRQVGRTVAPFLRPEGTSPAGNGWIFSIKEEGARRLMAESQLALRARDMHQERVHLVIVGFGDQGRAVLLEALLDATAIDLAPPRVTVIDRRAGELAAQFAAQKPRFFDGSIPAEARPAIEFVAADVGALDMANDGRLAAVEQAGRPTAYVVCCGEDAVNLDAGLRLEQAMRRSERLAAPVYLALRGAGMRAESPPPRGRAGLLYAFGSIDAAVAEARLGADNPDAVAMRLNAAYNTQAAEVGLIKSHPATPEEAWAGLSETMRESNRRAVRHARTKLLDLGFRWRSGTTPDLPVIDRETAARFRRTEAALDYAGILDEARVVQPTPEATLLAKSVLAEHRRWLIDRAMDDWRQLRDGERRDNARRIHNNIVPFAALTSENKRFDAMFIRALLAELSTGMADGGPASPRQVAPVFLAGESSADALVVPDGTTDVVLGWSSLLASLPKASADRFVAAILAWSRRPAAARLIVHLGHPAPSRTPEGRESMNSVLERMAAAVDHAVTVDVVHAYGLGVSENEPGLDDATLRALLTP